MSTLNDARMPALADKLAAQEQDLLAEEKAVKVELTAVKKAKKRAKKN